jgi:prefoldin subunit 5
VTDDPVELTPKQIASLRAQLEAANARLLAVERRRRELQEYIAALTDQLKRAEGGADGRGE